MERRDYESQRLEGWTLEKHNEQRGGCLGRVRRRRWNNSPCGRSKLLSQSHIQSNTPRLSTERLFMPVLRILSACAMGRSVRDKLPRWT
ncbi:hypothetical protein B0T13DRAFT_471625 [Neurospora crassa]|nr:hypothetical protein B0T13DRAFT_471625 [Neurospora crassa]